MFSSRKVIEKVHWVILTFTCPKELLLCGGNVDGVLLQQQCSILPEEYSTIPLRNQVVTLAVNLTRRYPPRGYDAVHLATAIILNTALVDAEESPIIFVSADEALCEIARSEKAFR